MIIKNLVSVMAAKQKEGGIANAVLPPLPKELLDVKSGVPFGLRASFHVLAVAVPRT